MSTKVKYTMDRNANATNKQSTVAKVMREMGSRVTVSGDVIVVDDYEAQKVADILNRENMAYSRST